MPGLGWSGVGNTYRRNVVRNGPHTAAEGGGNDNLFDGNYFDTLAYEVDDTGAWYAGRSWAKRNNTLINNVFVNVTNEERFLWKTIALRSFPSGSELICQDLDGVVWATLIDAT